MRKVLSFVLILALVLSSFSMAFAGSSTEIKNLSDVSGNANQSAIEVAYDLGIVTGNPDGTFQPAKAVTRAEYAAMITRALAIPDSALAGYANTSFKDTNGYAWAVPYLAFCNSKGIMLGDGAGNAMPGKTITVNEAVTMALRAVGYTANSAELTGVWPSNYVTKAQELKLYDDVAKDATGVDKANAAQIIYNTLSVDKVSVNSDGKTEKIENSKGDYVSLLTAGLNCTEEKGVVLTSSMIGDSVICAAKYVGQHGNLYKNDDDEIVAFIAKDCEQIVGRFVADGDGVKFTTTGDEKDYTLATKSTSDGALILENGRETSKDLNTDITKIDNGLTTPEYVLSGDISGKNIKTIYSVNRWVADGSDQVTTSNISDINDDHSLLNSDFVEDDNDAIDYTQFQLVGVASLSDIKADNVVYVFADKDGIRRIEVGTQVAEGTVKNFKNAKSDIVSKFGIGANTYKNAAEAENNINGGGKVESGNVSDDVKAFLDARGFVYDFTNTTTANNYAVVEKVSASSSIKDEAKVMLADGSEKTLSFDSDADKAGDLAAGTIIGYGLDKNGEITDSNRNYIAASEINLSNSKVINTVKEIAGTRNNFRNSNVTTTTAINNTRIADNAVVFTYKTATTASVSVYNDKTKVPNDANVNSTANVAANGYYTYVDDYDVTTIDKVDVDKSISGAGVILLLDEENNGAAKIDKVVAMFIPDSSAKSGSKSYAVINDLNKDANADGDKVFHMVGYVDGKKVDTYTDDWSTSFFKDYTDVVYSKDNLKSVRLYQVKTDASGVVTDATLFDKDTKGFDNDSKLYSTDILTLTDADGNDSVVATGGTRYALANNAVVYQVTKDDEYKVYTGDFQKNDQVILYETDDDQDGYDIAVFVRY